MSKLLQPDLIRRTFLNAAVMMAVISFAFVYPGQTASAQDLHDLPDYARIFTPELPVQAVHSDLMEVSAGDRATPAKLRALQSALSASAMNNRWSTDFGHPQVLSDIRTSYFDGTNLHIGGWITLVSDGINAFPSGRLPAFDGNEYSSDPDFFVNHNIHSIVEYNGDLIIGGEFAFAVIDNFWEPVPYLVRWDGERIIPFPTGPDNLVRSLLVHDDKLYVGGGFEKIGDDLQPYIAVWDFATESWESVPGADFIMYSHWDGVTDMTVYNDEVIVGGSFWSQTPGEFGNIARIGADGFEGLGSGFSNRVTSLAVYQDQLVAGGWFAQDGDMERDLWFLARWDAAESTWVQFDEDHHPNNIVTALAADGDKLYVGGEFLEVSGMEILRTAVYDQNGWQEFGGGSDIVPNGFAIAHGGVYRLGTAGQATASYNAETFKFSDGGDWQPIGTAGGNSFGYYSNSGSTLIFDTAVGEGGMVYAAGVFNRAGDTYTSNVARWDGFRWSPLGDGLHNASSIPMGQVTAIEKHGRTLFAGGIMGMSGSRDVGSFAMFHDGEWIRPGPGINYDVRALKSTPYGLFVAGFFPEIDGSTFNSIALYRGGFYDPLGSGLTLETQGSEVPYVFALHYHEGYLYVGGRFDLAGGVESPNIARWSIEDMVWEPVGDGIDDVIYAITHYDGYLIAGGRSSDFDETGLYVFDEDDEEWYYMELGFPTNTGFNEVRALHVIRDDLYVGGNFFNMVDGERFQGLAILDGETGEWVNPGRVNGTVLTISHDFEFAYVGGNFQRTDFTSAVHFGAYRHEKQIPGIPVLTHPGPGAEVVEGSVTFTWSEVPDAASYDFEITIDPTFQTILYAEYGQINEEQFDIDMIDLGFTWFWRVRARIDGFPGFWSHSGSFNVVTGTSADEHQPDRPLVTGLHQNYPNPFNPGTQVHYELANSQNVNITVYDVLGRVVQVLVNDKVTAGVHSVHFDGSGLSSGMYIVRMQTGSEHFSRTMMLLK